MSSTNDRTGVDAAKQSHLARTYGDVIAHAAAGVKISRSNIAFAAEPDQEQTKRINAEGGVTAMQLCTALGFNFSTFMSSGCIPQPDVSQSPRVWSYDRANAFLAQMRRPLLAVPATAQAAKPAPPAAPAVNGHAHLFGCARPTPRPVAPPAAAQPRRA